MTHDELLAKLDTLNYLGRVGYISSIWNALRAVVELHKPFELNNALVGKIMVCDECCKKYTYSVTKKCQMEHEHGEGLPWCPNTIPAIEKELK